MRWLVPAITSLLFLPGLSWAGVKVAATDCTTPACTAGMDGEMCYERDDMALYTCDGGIPAWGFTSSVIGGSGTIARFADADTTPDVDSGTHFITSNAGGETITDFDCAGGDCAQFGRIIHVRNVDSNPVNAVKFDCDGSANLLCGTVDISMAQGDYTMWVSVERSGGGATYWQLLSTKDATQDYGSYFLTEDEPHVFGTTHLQDVQIRASMDLGTPRYFPLGNTTPSVSGGTVFYTWECVDDFDAHCADQYNIRGKCDPDYQCSGTSDGTCDFDGLTGTTSPPQRYLDSAPDDLCDADASTTFSTYSGPPAPITITNLIDGVDGQVVYINTSDPARNGQLVTIDCTGAGFVCGGNDIPLDDPAGGETAIFIYNGSTSKWHLLGLETFSDAVKVGLRSDNTLTGDNTFEGVSEFEGELDIGTEEALPAGTTPSVAGGTFFKTSTAGTYTDFTGGIEGQVIFIRNAGHIATIDCTQAALSCGTTAIPFQANDSATFIYVNSKWELISFTDASANLVETYLPLSGGTMTGAITSTVGGVIYEDNIPAAFGTASDATITYDGTNLLINPQAVGSGYTDFTDAIVVGEDEDVYSHFGADPTTLSVSDTTDTLVSRKERTTASNTRRAILGAVDIDTDLALGNTGTFGMNAFVYTDAANTISSTRTNGAGGLGGGRMSVRHQAAGTLAMVGGIAAEAEITGADEDGVITNGYGFLDEGGDGGAGVGGITQYQGVWIKDSTGNVTTKNGIYIEDLTNATTDIGIRVDGADTYGIWLGAGSAVTTPADGITFGSGADVNLYRSAADTLKTDDDFVVGGDLHGNKDSKCTYIDSPATDDEFLSIWRAPYDLTFTEIWCETDAGTILADLEVDDGTPTGVNGSDISCAVSPGTTDSTLGGDTVLADGETLDLDLGTVTTAVRLSLCWEYTVN